MARVELRSGLSDANRRPVALRPDVVLGQEAARHVAEHQLAPGELEMEVAARHGIADAVQRLALRVAQALAPVPTTVSLYG